MFVFLITLTSTLVSAKELTVQDYSVHTESRLIGLALSAEHGIWVSGTQGAVFQSKDQGDTWQKVKAPAGTDEKQFRDIAVLDNGMVLLMSVGEGRESAVYRSDDQGKNWTTVLEAEHGKAFFDCMDFENSTRGWLYGDSVGGQLFVMQTTDGGKHWQRVSMPFAAQQGEGGFASSGTCLDAREPASVFIGTGNSHSARLLIHDAQNWTALDTPVRGGEASGIFTLSRSEQTLYLAGGGLGEHASSQPAQVFAYEFASGQWQDLGDPLLLGAIYGSALSESGLLVSNPQGTSLYSFGTQQWQKIDDTDIWSLSCHDSLGCWGVGAKGSVRRMSFD